LIRSTTRCFYCDSKIVWYRWHRNQLVRVLARCRTHCIRCGDLKSTPPAVLFGVSQGLALGPILFLLYTADLLRLVESHGSCVHLYADHCYGFCHQGDTAQHQNMVSTKLQCGRINCTLMLTGPRFSVSSVRWQHQIPDEPLLVRSDTVTKSSVCVRSRHLC